MTRPEFSLYDMDSQWVVENHGVDPDVAVDNRPDLVMQGHDPQLEKAVELVMPGYPPAPRSLPHRPSDLPAYPKQIGRSEVMKNSDGMKTREFEVRQNSPLITPTDLKAAATKDIAGAMNAILADVFALYVKTKNFHWHMSGPHFRDYSAL